MTEHLSYCGGDCEDCAVHLATIETDEAKRYEMRIDIAEMIGRLYGQKCKPEEVADCDGCKSETGRHINPD